MSTEPESQITEVPKRILLDLSPFEVDFSTRKVVKKVSQKGKAYVVYSVVVNALGGTGKYRVELFESEYLRLKILHTESGVKAYEASEKPNAKSGFSDLVFSPFMTVS